MKTSELLASLTRKLRGHYHYICKRKINAVGYIIVWAGGL